MNNYQLNTQVQCLGHMKSKYMSISKGRFEKDGMKIIIMDINVKNNLLPGLGLQYRNFGF